jgi:hypothetical protein
MNRREYGIRKTGNLNEELKHRVQWCRIPHPKCNKNYIKVLGPSNDEYNELAADAPLRYQSQPDMMIVEKSSCMCS